MNYFTHAFHHLDQPYFAAGTAVPDWLSVADRKVRLRPRQLASWFKDVDPIQAQIAAGAAQHLHDDDWFHCTRGFAEVTLQLTHLFRAGFGAGDQYHCGFLGHVGMELLLDSVLMERHPQRFEDYYRSLAEIDPQQIQTAVNRMARQPTERLATFVEVFRSEQFLRDYADDERFLHRLNQVLRRVKLSPLPPEAAELIGQSRRIVRQRIDELLPADLFCSTRIADKPPETINLAITTEESAQ